jgi:hypothetical protein
MTDLLIKAIELVENFPTSENITELQSLVNEVQDFLSNI